MKLQRLSGRKRCDRVLKKGYEWRGRHLSVSWLPGPPFHPDVARDARGVFAGVLTSTRLHKSAVKRNRMRRRTREALRRYVKDHEAPTVQLLLRPKSSSLLCAFSDIERDISAFFSTIRT